MSSRMDDSLVLSVSAICMLASIKPGGVRECGARYNSSAQPCRQDFDCDIEQE